MKYLTALLVGASLIAGSASAAGTKPPKPPTKLASPNPHPHVKGAAPAVLTYGTLTVLGKNFVSSSTIWLDGTSLPTTFVDAQTLRATLLPSMLTSAEHVTITVISAGPGGGVSNQLHLRVANNLPPVNPAPTLSLVYPTSFSVYAQDTGLYLSGDDLLPGATVYWNGTALATQYVSPTVVTATAPASLFAAPASSPPVITVANPAPNAGASSGYQVTLNCDVPQVISGPLSITGQTTDGSFQTYIVGTVPQADLSVSWNGTPLTVQSVTHVNPLTMISVTVPAADLETSGTAEVTVTDICGSSQPLAATVTVPTPTLASVSPDGAYSVQGGAGGTATITGSGFLPDAVVSVDGAPRTTTYVSASQVTIALTAADVAEAGVHVLTAANDRTGAGQSAPYYYTVGYDLKTIHQYAYDIVWDDAHQVLYASSAYWAPTNTNTLMTIDPASAQITGTVATSATPDILAISDDDSYLYVGFGHTDNVDSSALPYIRRYTLPSLTQDISWTVGAASNFAMAISVQPGAAHTVAVTRASTGDALIYDDGVARTNAAGHVLYDLASPNWDLAWSPDGSSLYITDFEYSNTLSEFSVAPSGVTLSQTFSETPPVNFSITGAHQDAMTGYLFLDDGLVIDPATGAVVTTLNLNGQPGEGVVLDDAAGVIYVAFAGDSPNVPEISIVRYDLKTFAAEGTAAIVTYYPDAATRLTRWGSHGLALLEGFGTIDILQGDFVK